MKINGRLMVAGLAGTIAITAMRTVAQNCYNGSHQVICIAAGVKFNYTTNTCVSHNCIGYESFWVNTFRTLASCALVGDTGHEGTTTNGADTKNTKVGYTLVTCDNDCNENFDGGYATVYCAGNRVDTSTPGCNGDCEPASASPVPYNGNCQYAGLWVDYFDTFVAICEDRRRNLCGAFMPRRLDA
jgi:hypothetical protein